MNRKMIFVFCIFFITIESKSVAQAIPDSFKLKIEGLPKSISSQENNFIIYKLINISSNDKTIVENPIIGYKSDKIIEGYFEVQIKEGEDWASYKIENSDYNYRDRGTEITLPAKSTKQFSFNISLLYHFGKGVYRLRLYLFEENKKATLISNWLTFFVIE